jgi:acyl dehydratase
VGETIVHDRRRTVPEADSQRVCDLAMNRQSLQLDADFAADTVGHEDVNTLEENVPLPLAPGRTGNQTVASLVSDSMTRSSASDWSPVSTRCVSRSVRADRSTPGATVTHSVASVTALMRTVAAHGSARPRRIGPA